MSHAVTFKTLQVSCQFSSTDETTFKLEAESPFFPRWCFKFTWMATQQRNLLFYFLSLPRDCRAHAGWHPLQHRLWLSHHPFPTAEEKLIFAVLPLAGSTGFLVIFFLLFCVELDGDLALTLYLLSWHKRSKSLCATGLQLLCLFSAVLTDFKGYIKPSWTFRVCTSEAKKNKSRGERFWNSTPKNPQHSSSSPGAFSSPVTSPPQSFGRKDR